VQRPGRAAARVEIRHPGRGTGDMSWRWVWLSRAGVATTETGLADVDTCFRRPAGTNTHMELWEVGPGQHKQLRPLHWEGEGVKYGCGTHRG
jgi:hypothetical protein